MSCPCLGCEMFHHANPATEGREAHQARITMALDRSIQALLRSRGMDACDGIDEYDQHDGPCDAGELHTLTSEFALALGGALEEPGDSAVAGALGAMARLMISVHQLTAGKPRVS